MLLQEKDQAAFKGWLLPKLESISDAEAGVLADYVAALVAVDENEANIRRNCIESLEDFLGKDDTEPFVNDVISALKRQTYLPKAKSSDAKPPPQAPQSAPIQSIVGSANFEYEPHPSNAPFDAPRGPAATRYQNASHRLPDRPTAQGIQQDGLNQPRKRKNLERENSQSQDMQDPHYNRNAGGNNRPLKQAARRGGRNARPGDAQSQNAFYAFNDMPNFGNLPPPPPGPLPFDPSDPTAFLAMAAAFGANLPGMPSLPSARGNGSNRDGHKAKCTNYFEKGFCAMGNFCPFEHSDEAIAVPADQVPEYDPEQSFLAAQPNRGAKKTAASHSQTRTKGGKPRAAFSKPGPSHDRSNTTLVVEQIPPENLNEDSIRDYFSEFGAIVQVDLRAERRLAIIKFADRSAANRAYNSPKAIFENRFVKVYWYWPDPLEDGVRTDDHDEEKLDLEAIAIKQAEAQKAFEERRRREEEAAARAAEIERQLKEKNEEMDSIKRQLAELSGEQMDDFSQTLETLQAEAAELFDQHDPNDPSSSGRGRGTFRGGYRGHEFAPYPPRGRGFTHFNGAFRGRGRGRGLGSFPPSFAGRSAVKRLDNRPRRLAVSGIEADTPRDEALRQYLLNIPDCTTIDRHPEQPHTLILTFKERYQADMFLDQSRNIPEVGKLDLAWVPNDAFGGLESSTTTTTTTTTTTATTDAATAQAGVEDDDDGDSSATIGEPDIKVEEDEGHMGVGAADADMDVADDVDQWL